jgi:hypothetical protein
MVTDATGTTGTVTVTVLCPVTPSLLAVMLVVPPPTAVTRPVELTVAIDVLALVQTTARPERTLLLASRVTAVSCAVAPT